MKFVFFACILALSVAVTREDIQYCGLYESKCLSDPAVSLKQTITLNGMMHHEPIYEQREVTSYWGPVCGDDAKLQTLTASISIAPINGVVSRYEAIVEKYIINFANEGAFRDYRCTEPLKVGVDYDITTLECLDGAAQDPFALLKAEIGVPQINQIIFEEESITVPYKTSELTLPRVDDTGCHCN